MADFNLEKTWLKSILSNTKKSHVVKVLADEFLFYDLSKPTSPKLSNDFKMVISSSMTSDASVPSSSNTFY